MRISDWSSDVCSSDLRYAGKTDAKSFWKHFLFTPGYKYTVVMRSCGYLRTRKFMAFGLYPLAKWWLLRCRYKYGIAIPEYTVIGPGLFIRSEEHTSELQSLMRISYAVFCLIKKNTYSTICSILHTYYIYF